MEDRAQEEPPQGDVASETANASWFGGGWSLTAVLRDWMYGHSDFGESNPAHPTHDEEAVISNADDDRVYTEENTPTPAKYVCESAARLAPVTSLEELRLRFRSVSAEDVLRRRSELRRVSLPARPTQFAPRNPMIAEMQALFASPGCAWLEEAHARVYGAPLESGNATETNACS